ncbi:acyl-CoA carboxylase subunit beta [Nanoarchaeota archaeon]
MKKSADLKTRKKAIIDTAIEQQHSKGKLTARERIQLLLDNKSFVELDLFMTGESQLKGDGVVTGHGTIDKRKVFVYSQDFTQKGGTLGEVHAKKIIRVMEQAIKTGCPIIGIEDSGGARIQEGVKALDGYAQIFYLNTLASGVVPQLSIVLGPCAGGAVYSPALTDFIFVVKGLSKMFITGPKVIKNVLGEQVSFENLGGADILSKMSGVAHFELASEQRCLLHVRRLLSYLPSNNLSDPPSVKKKDKRTIIKKLAKIVPSDPEKTYDIRKVIIELVDKGSFFEIQPEFAQNITVGFARIDSGGVGIVANQPKYLAGCLDIDASTKAARFVRFCDSFNIPIVNLVDIPGYLPGKDQEHSGIIRHGAELLYAYAESTVPKISVVLRKAYGGAYIVLASKKMGYDRVVAWPEARIAVMGARQAAEIIFKDGKHKETKVKEYEEEFLNPYKAAEVGAIDAIIEPQETRITLIKELSLLKTKKVSHLPRKHGNIPL